MHIWLTTHILVFFNVMCCSLSDGRMNRCFVIVIRVYRVEPCESSDASVRELAKVFRPEGHCITLRGVQLHDWKVLHAGWIEEWDNRCNTRCEICTAF
ncbi:hypothetical protein Ahy_B08g093285 isoform A [Arachis hypogaea]|uniref:Secreted protein n=1 Tax=Arachis hypogaea TaxID=3818 RepID=A0A444Y5S0_ARAHY|nr:hypothetical protein Ahy_B08g093285 isoform A [Arachis hypogaea]